MLFWQQADVNERISEVGQFQGLFVVPQRVTVEDFFQLRRRRHDPDDAVSIGSFHWVVRDAVALQDAKEATIMDALQVGIEHKEWIDWHDGQVSKRLIGTLRSRFR
jgi:hypothetical protein